MIHYKEDEVERAQHMLEALFGKEWLMEGSGVVKEELRQIQALVTEGQNICNEIKAEIEKRVPAQYYDFPYDGHAVFHPTWGLRIQVLDDGYAQMSATEARRFSDWLAELVKNVPAPPRCACGLPIEDCATMPSRHCDQWEHE